MAEPQLSDDDREAIRRALADRPLRPPPRRPQPNGGDPAQGVVFTFNVFGFPVGVQQSLLAMAAFYVLGGGVGLGDPRALLGSVVSILAIFASILWHELGHAVVATRLGQGPAAIVLHGFGGYTSRARAGKPWQDMLVSVAGPFAALLIGIPLALVSPFLADGFVAVLVSRLVFVNVYWSLFNLLPMYPLDGGQATFAALRWGFSTRAAVAVTSVLGFLGAAGLVALSALIGRSDPFFVLFLLYVAWKVGSASWTLFQRMPPAAGAAAS